MLNDEPTEPMHPPITGNDTTVPTSGQGSTTTQPATQPKPLAQSGLFSSKRWLWLIAALFLAIILIFVLAYNSTLPGTTSTSYSSGQGASYSGIAGAAINSFQVGDNALLILQGHNSDVTVHAGNATMMLIQARKHGSMQPPDSDVRVRFDRSHDDQGHDVVEATTDPLFKDLDYDVTLPATASIRVEIDSGSVAINGTHGAQIDTNNGSLILEDIQGPVNAHTENGDITARSLKGPMVLEAGNGSVRLNDVTGPLRALTRSGDVVVRGAHLSGVSSMKTSSGSVRVEGTFDAQGTYSLATNSGDINLTLPNTAAFQLAATIGSGPVHNDFGSNLVGNAPRAQINVTIGSGSVSLNKGA